MKNQSLLILAMAITAIFTATQGCKARNRQMDSSAALSSTSDKRPYEHDASWDVSEISSNIRGFDQGGKSVCGQASSQPITIDGKAVAKLTVKLAFPVQNQDAVRWDYSVVEADPTASMEAKGKVLSVTPGGVYCFDVSGGRGYNANLKLTTQKFPVIYVYDVVETRPYEHDASWDVSEISNNIRGFDQGGKSVCGQVSSQPITIDGKAVAKLTVKLAFPVKNQDGVRWDYSVVEADPTASMEAKRKVLSVTPGGAYCFDVSGGRGYNTNLKLTTQKFPVIYIYDVKSAN